MTATGLVPALVVAFAAPAPVRPRREVLSQVVVLRTATDVHVGHTLRFDHGAFHVQGEGGGLKVPEADLVRAVFLPRFGGLPLDLALGLAVGIVTPWRPTRGKGPWRLDPATVLRRYGGIFILPGDEPTALFPRFAAKVKDSQLTAILCYEFIRECQKEHERRAVEQLAEAERQAGKGDRGFVFGLMRAALLVRMGRLPEAKEAMDSLRKLYPDQEPLLTRFGRALRIGEGIRRMPRRRPEPPPRP